MEEVSLQTPDRWLLGASGNFESTRVFLPVSKLAADGEVLVFIAVRGRILMTMFSPNLV